MCSPHCPIVRTVLSCDEQSPLEARVAPLVYGLNALGVVQTTWSCEGHENECGELQRLPRVWFYSPSVAYVGLVHDYVYGLHLRLLLGREWRVTTVGQINSLECPLFALEPGEPSVNSRKEPELKGKSTSALGELHRDLSQLAKSFEGDVRTMARQEVQKIEAFLSNCPEST